MRRRLAVVLASGFGLLALGAATVGAVGLTALFLAGAGILGLDAARSKRTPLRPRDPAELAAERDERRREREQRRREATT